MIDKVYEIIDVIEDTKLKKDLVNIKDKIKQDSKLKTLLKEFEIAKENYEKYSLGNEYINKKKELLDNNVLKTYINIQNEINILSLKINKRINDITKGITDKK